MLHARGLNVADPAETDRVVARLRGAGCVFAEQEATLLVAQATDSAELDALTARRVSGLPLEQVLGWAQFCGLRIRLDPGVFVPRRRSEFLVSVAVALAPLGAVVLDLCCGSGALGAAVRAAVHDAELHAADSDPVAVRCARANLGPGAGVYQGDLFAPLPDTLRHRVDVLLANVPYVPTDDIGLLPPEAREHEPLASLDGGPDGLEVLRRVCAGAAGWLAPGGHLLSEVSDRQVPAGLTLLRAVGLAARAHEQDEATVVVGTAAILNR